MISIFRGSTGLNTKIDPARLYSKEGIKDLAVAADVDVTDTGRISRRKGYTERASIESHSLFCDKGKCLFVSGTSLYELLPDYSYTVLAAVTANKRVSYTEINERIYWCNGTEKGYITDKNNSWVKGNYIGPTSKRTLSDPPTGTIVEYYKNRMYVAQENVLWYSEPGAFGAFDLARGFFQWATEIRMVRAVDNGIFVSTEKNTYLLLGRSPLQFEQVKVAGFPAIKHSDCKLNGYLSESGIIEGTGQSAMWVSPQGVCYGGNDGFRNLTIDKIANFSTGRTGSGLVYNNKFLGLINP